VAKTIWLQRWNPTIPPGFDPEDGLMSKTVLYHNKCAFWCWFTLNNNEEGFFKTAKVGTFTVEKTGFKMQEDATEEWPY
jgi:hypothetical protein